MSRISRSILVLAIAGLPFFGGAMAAETKDAEQPVKQPAAVQPGTDEILADISLNDQSLEDALSLIEASHPRFKAVIFRDAMTSKDFPRLTMKLKGVSIGQFFQLITTAFPTVEQKVIDGPQGLVFCFMVHPDAKGMAAIPATTRVYSLAGTVGGLSGGEAGAKTKAALDHVLSLIKAALDEVGGEPPTLRVHEETQVLIFKGSREQEAVVSSVLKLLGPDEAILKRQEERADSSEAAKLRHEVDQSRYRLAASQAQIEELRKAIASRDAESSHIVSDSERLKVRLEMTEGRARELEKQLAIKSAEADNGRDMQRALKQAMDEAAELRRELSQRPSSPKPEK